MHETPNVQLPKQAGFTLIELMIVVAIIGVLSSIAIPQYQNYTARAQASEALTITAGVRTDIAEQYSLKGEMPERKDLGLDAEDKGFSDMSGRYVDSVSYNKSAISVKFSGDSALGGATMKIEPASTTGDINLGSGWTCSWSSDDIDDIDDIDDSWLPSACKEVNDSNGGDKSTG